MQTTGVDMHRVDMLIDMQVAYGLWLLAHDQVCLILIGK